MSRMPLEILPPMEVVGIFHYHQPIGRQPLGMELPEGLERVEVLTGGRGWCNDDGTWREVIAGDVLWHMPGDSTIQRSDMDDPYRCLAVTFRSDVLHGERRVPRFTRWEDLPDILKFTRESVQLSLDESFEKSVLLANVFGRLWYQATLSARAEDVRPSEDPLNRVRKRIDEDYAKNLTTELLALEAGYSVPHLHERFRSRFSTTPHAMLIGRRIQAARELLASTDMPVKVIAQECGFSDASGFCHAFKRLSGVSPGAFRQRLIQPDPSN